MPLPERIKQLRRRSVRNPVGELVNVLCGKMLERRGLATADFIRGRLPDGLLISQRVSIARALLPYVRSAAAARQASTGTAPGRPRARKRAPLHSLPFVGRCVGFAPKTLRQAIKILEFVESNPDHRRLLFQMDQRKQSGRNSLRQGVCPIYRVLSEGDWGHSECMYNPRSVIGTEFGAQLLRELAGNLPQVSKALGASRKKTANCVLRVEGRGRRIRKVIAA
jgi:hypothetical protein